MPLKTLQLRCVGSNEATKSEAASSVSIQQRSEARKRAGKERFDAGCAGKEKRNCSDATRSPGLQHLGRRSLPSRGKAKSGGGQEPRSALRRKEDASKCPRRHSYLVPSQPERHHKAHPRVNPNRSIERLSQCTLAIWLKKMRACGELKHLEAVRPM